MVYDLADRSFALPQLWQILIVQAYRLLAAVLVAVFATGSGVPCS
jgi:hypothetical protein